MVQHLRGLCSVPAQPKEPRSIGPVARWPAIRTVTVSAMRTMTVQTVPQPHSAWEHQNSSRPEPRRARIAHKGSLHHLALLSAHRPLARRALPDHRCRQSRPLRIGTPHPGPHRNLRSRHHDHRRLQLPHLRRRRGLIQTPIPRDDRNPRGRQPDLLRHRHRTPILARRLNTRLRCRRKSRNRGGGGFSSGGAGIQFDPVHIHFPSRLRNLFSILRPREELPLVATMRTHMRFS